MSPIDQPAFFREASRRSFNLFAKRAFGQLNPTTTFKDNWHIDAVCHALEQVRTGATSRLILNLPPRSLKSEITSVALPAFILGHDPGARIICLSYSSDLATKFARRSRDLLDAPWYQELFPKTVLSKASEGIMETTQGGARLSTSFEAGITGHGGSMIIIDDPLTPGDAASSAARKKVITFYRDSLLSRFDDPATGKLILTMQRLHEEDLAGYLLRVGGFEHLNLPAISPEDQQIAIGDGQMHFWAKGELLDGQRLSKPVLDERRRNLSSAGFSAQYLQNPVPADGDMLKRDWIRQYDQTPDLAGMRIVQSWDTAIKGTVEADYSVCTTWAERNDDHYLLDVFRKKLNMPDLVDEAVNLQRRYSPDAVLIEDQGSGSGLIDFLRKRYGIRSIGLRPKGDKITRFSSATFFFEKQQVQFPANAAWLADLEHELLAFPGSRHDDQVDSISQYLNWSNDRSGQSFICHNLWDDTQETPETLMDVLANMPRY